MSGKKPGRPVGAKTEERDLVDAGGSRCARCGCTDRTKYSSRIEVIGCGVNREGLRYTSVVCRHTQCLNPDCGQHRIDRFYENSCE